MGAERLAALLEALRFLVLRGDDGVIQAVERALGRVGEVRVGRDDVRLEVVERELRGLADLVDRVLCVLDLGQADGDLALADTRDLWLCDAKCVNALADEVDRAIDVLDIDRCVRARGTRLVDELGAAREVDALTRPLGRDGVDRRDDEHQDEAEDDVAAATRTHRQTTPAGLIVPIPMPMNLLRGQDQQEAAVVVVGGEDVGHCLGGKIALGVHLHPPPERAHAPLERGADRV